MSYQSPAGEGFAVFGERREGVVRLFASGELDVSTAPILQREVDAAVDAGGAVIIDLRGLTFLDSVGLWTLERIAEHARREAWRLCIVNCFGLVREEFDAAGGDALLGSITVSDLLDGGEGAWSSIPVPSLLGQQGVVSPHVDRRGR